MDRAEHHYFLRESSEQERSLCHILCGKCICHAVPHIKFMQHRKTFFLLVAKSSRKHLEDVVWRLFDGARSQWRMFFPLENDYSSYSPTAFEQLFWALSLFVYVSLYFFPFFLPFH